MTQENKISTQFRGRLRSLKPNQQVRAVLMLKTGNPAPKRNTRNSSRERSRILKSNRKSFEIAMVDIDRILERYKGRRLVEHPNSLGAIPVEVSPKGIIALTDSNYVKVILEDQTITYYT